MMKKTLSCATHVAFANTPVLTSCYMLNHAVQWILSRMKKTGKRYAAMEKFMDVKCFCKKPKNSVHGKRI